MKLKNVIVFYPPEPGEDKPKVRKYRRVQSLDKLAEWLKKDGAGNWEYANIYDSRTKEFVERVYQ